MLFSVIVVVGGFLQFASVSGAFLDNINSVLCSAFELDGFDPNRVFRTGHKYTLDECVSTSQLNDISDLTNCAIAPRRRAPACDSYYASNAGEEWTPAVSAQGPFFTPFYPGGPGLGQSPFPSWAIACNEAYPLGSSSVDNIDYATQFLCEKPSVGSSSSSSSSSDSSDEEEENKWSPFDLIFCKGNTQGVDMITSGICQTGAATGEQFCQIDLTSQYFSCDGELPDTSSNPFNENDDNDYDCMIFTKFIGIAGADCEHAFFGGDSDDFNSLGNNRFGFEWYNSFPIGGTLGFIPNAEAHLLCGKKRDWRNENMQHTICKISDFDNLMTMNSYFNSDDFVQKGYIFTDDDCSNGVPSTTKDSSSSDSSSGSDSSDSNEGNGGSCIATIRSTRYCCEYSFNFNGIGPGETVDGVTGPGVTFQIWKDGEMDESVCNNRSLKKDVQIEYLCFQE